MVPADAADQPPRGRDPALDALRGLAMVLMALDHVREFFHRDALAGIPVDALHSGSALFLTRWITHLCAPTFAVATGIGAWLWCTRHRGSPRRYLVTRGLWLICLELVVIRFAYFWGWSQGPVILSVMWSLGASMVLLAAVQGLPRSVLLVSAAGFLAGYGLLGAGFESGPAAAAWHLLVRPGVFMVAGVPVVVGYPALPWAAMVLLGHALAPWLCNLDARAAARVRNAGLALLCTFVVLRVVARIGDPVDWQPGTGLSSLWAALDCAKYPPSLDFVLMTLGIAALLLAWFSGPRGQAIRVLGVFGRAPLFYYVVHLFLIHALAFPLAWARYGTMGFLLSPLPSLGGAATAYPAGYGYPLAVVYALWVGVVLALYPLCGRLAALRVARAPSSARNA